jgi:DNA-binding FadR family transcriptional regulator
VTPTPQHEHSYRGPGLHGQVVQELGRRIAGGHYPPGTVLPPEEELCVALGVSRTALREAMRVLAGKGLLEARPRVGTRVRPSMLWNQLDPDVLAWRCASTPDALLLEQLTEMREIIEPAAAQRAARNRTPEQMQQIDAALAAMAAARRIGQWVQADVEFHRAVLSATGNALLMSLASLIAAALESLLHVSARRASDFRLGLPEHVRVRDAIQRGDTQAAMQAMQLLLADTRRRLLPTAEAAAADAVVDRPARVRPKARAAASVAKARPATRR